MENIIECKNLTHYYGKRLIYKDLSFNVPKGRILGLLGKNGTGKTTTINILSGFLKPREGNCYIFGEDIQTMQPALRQNIGLLIEGHVQYTFMNIEEIERYYAAFYPNWNRAAYYELMSKLKIAPKQKISRMSCGQRSQVALGLILAQNPELLVLDDFSLGLDPGYRRLFIEYLYDFAKSEGKTIFLTSHIIQDMERLVDDCIIMDYGKILTQQPVADLMNNFKRYTLASDHAEAIKALLEGNASIYNPATRRDQLEFYSFADQREVTEMLASMQLPAQQFNCETMNLEDIFIGLTGKY